MRGGEAGASPQRAVTVRANAGPGQKTGRPEGFRGKGRLAALLLSRRSTRDILFRRVLPSGLFPENSTPRNFFNGLQIQTARSKPTRAKWDGKQQFSDLHSAPGLHWSGFLFDCNDSDSYFRTESSRKISSA